MAEKKRTVMDAPSPASDKKRALETAILDAYRQYLDSQSASGGQLVPDHPVLPTANPS